MESIAETILQAARALGFDTTRFSGLSGHEAAGVYETALRHFVPKGSPQWWWEHFPASTSLHFEAGGGWRRLAELVPDPDEVVWFIAEDDGLPGYSVWSVDVRGIVAILAECFSFEYYIVPKRFQWLLCENHHDVVIAVGEEVERRLLACRAD